MELSFMPSALANCSSSYAPDAALVPCPTPGGWVKTGQEGMPRDFDEWFDLIFQTISTAVKRYGQYSPSLSALSS